MKKMYGALALAAMVGLSGCYGSFNLTRKVYNWQGKAGGKWWNEGAFLLTSIAYPFTVMGDSLVLNSIEFWTGKNPVMAKNVKSIQRGDEQAVLSFTPAEHRMRIDTFEKGRVTQTVILAPGKDGMEARDAKGNLVMSAKTVDGMVVVANSSGKQLGKYDPARLGEMLR